MIEEVNRVGVPLNTAAGQKASADVSSGQLNSSFTANVPPSSGFAAHGFGSFGAATTDVSPGPVNFFSSATPQQGSTDTGFAGSGSFMPSSQPDTFGSAQPDRANSSQSQTGACPASRVYTPLDQLSAEDRAQYEAPKFSLGHVPVRPPPKELI